VLYFYPPAGWQAGPFDVKATFNGGWLTEFYPDATAEGVDFPKAVGTDTRGSLSWKQVRLNPDAASLAPQTDEHVWLAPRQVRAATIENPEAREAEKYLFYRGVGHLEAPILVSKSKGWIELRLNGRTGLTALPHLWIVEVLPDGAVRYKSLDPGNAAAMRTQDFPPAKSGMATSLDELRRELASALAAQGLYTDEAAAMLDTWRLSYFQAEGLRVFFVLPQSWTDAQLPLSISTPVDVTRVMVGRIELVSAHQRAVLAKLQQIPGDAFPQRPLYYEDQSVLKASFGAARSHSDLYRDTGRAVPESLQLYESLGRFRDALLAHELKNATDAARQARLQKTLRTYGVCSPAAER
jgi:hypothetical protein